MSEKKTILIVDDEPDMVEYLKTLYEDNGFNTITASDGIEGFAKAESNQPDLISLDITMDKESGIKMYRNLSGSEKTKNIPVIMISGVSPEMKGFIESRKQVDPPAAYFEKPIDRDVVVAKVKELIG